MDPSEHTTSAVISGGSDVVIARYGGADRYATSLRVAEAVAAEAGGSLSSFVLASGQRWIDAVVAGTVTGALGAPVLMTPPNELRPDALAFMQRVGVSKAVVVGPDVRGGAHGPGRGVSDAAGQPCFATGTIGIARARVPFDSFSAAPLLARRCAPLVLADPGNIPDDTVAYLDGARTLNAMVDMRVFGGNAAVSQTAIETYLSAALSVLDHDACRPPSIDGAWTTVGFPIPETADSSSGQVKITVLFMDFRDAQATHTTHAEIDPGLRIVEEYPEAQSYANLDLVVEVVHRWWRAPHSYRTYLAADAAGATG